MQKQTANPDGRKGGKLHRDLIEKIKNYLRERGLFPKTEQMIILDDGRKKYVDIAGKTEDGIVELHQIGKQNKNGEPVARERKAIHEIEKATGKKVFFHAYNILKLFIFIIFVASLVILVNYKL